ncbi:hypothetical protein BF49_2649 [Bradyrhizobium sp.]|uniref:hypothetical protein n=1 Tax=Bradyrhizobium sp. TaxID=376 RepID=UPI0007C1A23A|nr:hypothetical protein [Bradyrhizobium sp.]CUT11569.1 hypothetical protein BF49_2649 [Bradyrhizobium sp.]
MNAKLGEKKRRRLNLLGRDPLCIFCGGTTPASTGDHQPARSFFDGRVWPEGYEFPACEPCNKKSKHHEHVLTTLVRLKGEEEHNASREVDFAKFAKAMKNNFPGLLRVLGPDEKGGFIKSRGLWVPVGRAFPLQLPMVAIDPQIAGTAVDAVFRKLVCALHYKHTGNILPADATITIKWTTNAGLPEFMTEEMNAFVAGLTEKPAIIRNGKDLFDQFDYRYRTADDRSASAYFIKFRQSIFGAGVALSKPDGGVEEAFDDGARPSIVG